MAVTRPIPLTITNYPEGKTETFEIENNPGHPEDGTRMVSFSGKLYVEAEDFLETPVPKYKRLYPDGPECRLKGAYLIRCTGCNKDENGNITEILCTYDPESRGGDPADGRKVKGATIHWVDAATAVDAEVRLYDNLFSDPDPDARRQELPGLPEPQLPGASWTGCQGGDLSGRPPQPGDHFQFMRLGYFCADKDSTPGAPGVQPFRQPEGRI